MAEQRWIPETLFDPEGLRMSYAVERVLYEQQTAHQHLVLFEHRFFGKMLMLDGATQVTSKDEFVYHEMMTHVPILAHGSARDILIVGGGDCGIAEEALKHKSVRRLTQVEIDASVIEFAREHFPEFTGPVFGDERFESVIGDGIAFVAETDRRFDVIIVDSTDPQGPGAVLFTEEFYRGCKRCLNKRGILVTQSGVPALQPDELATGVGRLRRLFRDATCYVAAIPTYVGGHMAMGFASDDRRHRLISEATMAQRYRRAGRFPTRYWTPAVHKAAFALPRFIQELVDRQTP
jgi:spermidine synthase